MPGEMIEVKDYNTVKHEMQTTFQNSYLLKLFGRNDFRPVDTKDEAREESLTISNMIKLFFITSSRCCTCAYGCNAGKKNVKNNHTGSNVKI